VAGPSWLAGVLAAAMILTAGYAASRLVAARLLRTPTEADTDGLHALMGTAMAGMFLPQLRLLPSSAWAVVFGAAGIWFAASAIRARTTSLHPWQCRFPVPHLVECMAMLYMLLAVPAGPGTPGITMPGMAAPGAAPGSPALALVLALFMLGYLLWTTDRLATRARHRTALAAPPQTQHQPLATVPAGPSGHVASPASLTGTPGAAETPPRRPGAGHPLLAVRYAECSKIVMSIAMGYMLITML
jgi:Domain of unknown function (DUF5134)